MSGGSVVVAQGWMAGCNAGVKLPEGWRYSDLADAAVEVEARTVYVVDHAGTAERVGHLDHGAWTLEVTGGDLAVPASVWRWRARPIPDGAPVSIVLVGNDEGRMSGPWQGMTARELLDAFAAFERLCGVPWADSIGHTAERLILATHPRDKGGVKLDQSPNVPEPVVDNALELPYAAWRRELLPAERGAKYVHAFDQRAQYLAAWGTTELGHGAPIHHQAPAFDPKRPGVWRIPGIDKLANLRPELPTPWLAHREWFTTPTVIRMLEVCEGYETPKITEAWTWPTHSRFLRSAGERLRDARTAAITADAEARAWLPVADDDKAAEAALRKVVTAQAVLQAVKDMYRVQTGRFGMARDPRSGWGRPDWGNTLRAQARCNLHRRLWKLGQAPFAIATDGLLFATDEPDALAFAQRIQLPIGDGLGKFSHDATVELDQVGELLTASRGVGKLFTRIGEMAS